MSGSNYNPYDAYVNGNTQSQRFFDRASETVEQPAPPLMNDPNFDIFEWYPAYQSCQRFFLDHAQYEAGTQALCALINIRLPFQYLAHPILSSTLPQPAASGPSNPSYSFTFGRTGSNNVNSPNRSRDSSEQTPPAFVSLVPYIRRLVVTAFDKAPILHGFFGEDYVRGVLPHLDCERRNYLFAAKHGGWRSCKKQYDSGSGMGGDESVPFMRPLDEARMEELTNAEKQWSGWLAMEDWMVGPRAPEHTGRSSGQAHMGGESAQMGRNSNMSNGRGGAFGPR